MDEKDRTTKRPGEKKPGKFHYNPGNMSGKTIAEPCPETGGEPEKESPKEPQRKGAR